MAKASDEFQTRIFHSNEWSLAVECRFVNGLLREATGGNYREGSVNNGTAVRRVLTEINLCFNTNFDYKYCYDQIRRLRRRYEAFTRIIGTKGVSWSEGSNKMQCDPMLWDEISKIERLALAYRVHGEIHYAALRRIFGVEDDSLGYNQLQPITDLSSSLNSMSIVPTLDLQNKEMPCSSLSHDNAANDSGCSDAGTPI